MNELYNRIELLCKNKGVNITQMCKESGAARGSITDLKKARITRLNTDTLSKIASYFGISIDYLHGNEDIKKEPVPISENELDLRLIEMLTSLTPDEMRQVDAFVQGLLAARKA